jgi:hypothetical protein
LPAVAFMGWLLRLLPARSLFTRRAKAEENQSVIRRAELAYQFVCKATEMQAGGVPLAKIKIVLVQLARSKGYKDMYCACSDVHDA